MRVGKLVLGGGRLTLGGGRWALGAERKEIRGGNDYVRQTDSIVDPAFPHCRGV